MIRCQNKLNNVRIELLHCLQTHQENAEIGCAIILRQYLNMTTAYTGFTQFRLFVSNSIFLRILNIFYEYVVIEITKNIYVNCVIH